VVEHERRRIVYVGAVHPERKVAARTVDRECLDRP
jgi:hypothetical protein